MIAQDDTLLRELPSGDVLQFTDGPRRSYSVLPYGGGKATRLVSVTTVLGVLNKPALMRWSENCGAAGALAAVRMGELDPAIHADEEAADVVRSLGLGADAAKKKAADRGLTVHDALQYWAEEGHWPQQGDMDPEHRPYMQGLARAILALDPEPLDVEQVTCDVANGVGGRFDLRARIDGRVTMCDLKTARGGRGYPEAHTQLAAYDLCEQSLGADPVERRLVIAVSPEGTFCADEGQASTSDWLDVLAVYRLQKRLNSTIDGWKRADKRAAKEAAV